MSVSKKSVLTFLRYTGYSLVLFVPEYFLFLLLITYTPFHYVTLTIGTFIFGITTQYAVVRRFVFTDSHQREWHSGYVLFMTSSTVGAGLVVLMMVVMVEILNISEITSRLIAAAAAGYFVYLFNIYANFQAPDAK